ncbi:MAG: diguanylate cyclase [Ruminococcaceae bacterium]|nr:diguanylate cyclase [Oscillospiraceae bacterium]
MKSIQAKILLSILFGMIILAIVLTTASTYYISSTLEKDSNLITESVANTESLRINEEFARIESAVGMMSTYVNAILDSPDSLGISSQEKSYTAKAKEMFSNIVQNTPGVTAFYLRYNPYLTTPHAGFFIGVSAGGQELVERETTDLSNWETKPHEQVGWYSDPITSGKAVWSTDYHNQNNSQNIITYVVPVYKNYTPYGVIGIEFDASLITDIVDKVSVYDNGFAYLTNGDGSIYYAPEHARIDALNTAHGYSQVTVPLDNGMNFELHADYKDIQRGGYRAIWAIIVITVFLLVAFMLFVYSITVRIVTPLKKLARSAEQLLDGKMEMDDSLMTNDEIGALAESLSKTSGKLEEYRKYIGTIAFRDSLTGVKNGTAYKEAQVELEKDIRVEEECEFAVAVVDINDLKKVNDAYGHEVGNRLIIETSKIICTAFKHSPVYRIGGDEFAVILKNNDYANRCDILRNLTEEYPKAPKTVAGGAVTVAFAIGIGVYQPGMDSGFDDVFRRADADMYKQKQATKG